MHQNIFDYLNTQRVGVLAVEMMDSSPHGATVHFANTEDPLIFYFETDKSYRKAQPILTQPETRATFVVGTSEVEAKTLQLDGIVRLITDEEKESYQKAYFGKFPEKVEKTKKNPNAIFLVFTPTWWRFTDWTTPEGKKIWSSDTAA